MMSKQEVFLSKTSVDALEHDKFHLQRQFNLTCKNNYLLMATCYRLGVFRAILFGQ